MLEKFKPEERDYIYKRMIHIIELFGGKDDITSILRNEELNFAEIDKLTDKWCYYKVNDITEQICDLENRLERQPSITVKLVRK